MTKTRIGAVEQAAKVKIEQQSIAAQTEVLHNGMTSPAALAFLNQLPAIDTLVPPLDFKLIEKLTGKTYESDAENKVCTRPVPQADRPHRSRAG